MKKYHELAHQARRAAAQRRQNNADLDRLVYDRLPSELGGKVAENEEPENRALTHETKVDGVTRESGSLVNTPNRLHALIKSPQVQHQIKQGKAHTKRTASRQQTMQERAAAPSTPWRRASEEEKFRYAGHAAERAGGFTFNLRLSDRTQKKLRQHRDPLRAFTDTMNRELKKAGLTGTPYGLALEVSTKGELHVHGFAVARDDQKNALRDAVRASGGHIPGKAGSRQLSMRKLTGGLGWAFYCRKDLEKTDEALAGSARLFKNRAMTQMAREFASRDV